MDLQSYIFGMMMGFVLGVLVGIYPLIGTTP